MREWYVPKDLESGNMFVWRNWYIYDSYKKKWHVALWNKIGVSKFNCITKMEGEIIRIIPPGKRAYDQVNFEEGAKPLPDYFVRYNWIKDDNLKWWKCEYKQEKHPKYQFGTIIRLKETK